MPIDFSRWTDRLAPGSDHRASRPNRKRSVVLLARAPFTELVKRSWSPPAARSDAPSLRLPGVPKQSDAQPPPSGMGLDENWNSYAQRWWHLRSGRVSSSLTAESIPESWRPNAPLFPQPGISPSTALFPLNQWNPAWIVRKNGKAIEAMWPLSSMNLARPYALCRSATTIKDQEHTTQASVDLNSQSIVAHHGTLVLLSH